IDSRTVLARWREGTTEGGDPDLSATLDIARRTGAAYAIVGTVLSVGSVIRLSADIYNLESRVSLGEVQAEGLPDSISGVIDKLSIEILRTILPSDTERLPSLRLAGITTTSVPALKAYLEGEALVRGGAYQEAVTAYERAIEGDSTFALAHLGLAESCGATSCDPSKIPSSYERAYRFIDRLPEREALLVRARHAFHASNPYLAREVLQTAVLTYPDDPMAWFFLSEVYLHYGGQLVTEGMGNWEALMERSVRLDPSNAMYLVHLVEDAFADRDSARARSLTQSYARLAGTDPRARAGSLAFALVFGDPASKARAMAATDTIDTIVLGIATTAFMGHPASTPVVEKLLRKITGRADADEFYVFLLFDALVSQGKLRAAREIDIDFNALGDVRGISVYILHKYNKLPGEGAVTNAMLEEILSASDSDTLAWFYSGSHAADRGRWDEHRDAMERLRRAGQTVAASGDTARARVLRGAADALEGYGEWRQGRPREALSRLEEARKDVVSYYLEGFWNETIRYWLATLLLELDQPEEAARYLESLWNQHYSLYRDPYTTYEVAKLRDRLSHEPEAIEAYEYALTGLQNGDPDVQPVVNGARRAITRLSGANE
ncbi:MAG TPA: tetratricopeptide repeat protein, partial [Gemmatimonadota bacterium]|nr:tetratricopeptide repeat protein [Gemmatimonadota bacterium]